MSTTDATARYADGPSSPLQRDTLTRFATAALGASGLPEPAAALVADTLVDADARGIGSHGVTRLPVYARRLRAGLVSTTAEPQLKCSGALVSVDARNAMGAVAAQEGMAAAVRIADELGVGAAGVRHSNHCGALGYYVRWAARSGFVAIAASNAPVTMAYHGGRTPAVGTNPFAVAVPRHDGPPIVVDVATSATARGKIIVAAAEGKSIPEGWAIDAEGHPTTDPHAALAGAVLPLAGPKGSGIAMMVDLLCGVLTGAASGNEIGDLYGEWDRPQNVGHAFLAIRPGPDLRAFAAQIEAFAAEIGELPPADGHERVLLPGEIEERALERARHSGITLPCSTMTALAELASELGIAPLGSA